MNQQKNTPYPPLRASYGVSFLGSLEKMILRDIESELYSAFRTTQTDPYWTHDEVCVTAVSNKLFVYFVTSDSTQS